MDFNKEKDTMNTILNAIENRSLAGTINLWVE